MPTRFTVRSAEDILSLLEHPEAGVRFAMLKTLVNRPERAEAYGEAGARCVGDALLSMLEQSSWGTFRLLVLHALLALDDPRAAEVCRAEFSRSSDVPTLLLVAKRLEREPEEVRRTLAPLLFDASADKARITARLLRRCADLATRERLQVALYAPDPSFDPPAVAEDLELWLPALHGPRSKRARALAQAQGYAAFQAIRAQWQKLSSDALAWLLDWAAQSFPAEVPALLEEVLGTGGEQAAVVALRRLPEFGTAGERVASLVGRYAEHPNPELRLAVLRGGLMERDLERIAREEAPQLRLAAIPRLVSARGPGALPLLLELLGDEDWRVRAAATSALVRLGRPAAEAVKPLVNDGRGSVRIAAVQVLMQLDETLWLEASLL